MNLIDYRLYDPTKALLGKKSDKAYIRKLYCSLPDCKIRKNNGCIMWNNRNCPYGNITYEEGYTRRAKKYYTWIKDKQDSVKEIKDHLSDYDKIGIVGDYIYFPYPFWSMDTSIDISNRETFLTNGQVLFKKDKFTIDLFEKIINAKPYSLMGPEIKSYSEKTVPEIINHTEEEVPDFYKQWAEKYPETAKQFIIKNHIGRTAILITCNKDSEFVTDKGIMKWDGKYITIDNYRPLFSPIKNFKSSKMIFEPSEKTTVIITDNNQVNKQTKFID
jgi:hypothetical protein